MTQEQLLILFEYRDGQIFWNETNTNRVKRGGRAGSLSPDGYRYVRINNKLQSEHRIIYMMHHGIVSSEVFIDHMDTNPLNNSIDNLRRSTHSQNLFNRGKQTNNTSGFKGVIFDKRDSKWYPRINAYGKSKSLGGYKTAELAHEAYKKAAKELHGEFANY